MAPKPAKVTAKQVAVLESHLKSVAGTLQQYQQIVNGPFGDQLLCATIDLGIVALLLVNEADGMIDRVALSNTEMAEGAVKASVMPFHDIRIPINNTENIIASAIKTKKHQITEDWVDLFTPALTGEEARRNQAGASIECSLVWPLVMGRGGAMIFSFYQPREFIGRDHMNFAKTYAELVQRHLATQPDYGVAPTRRQAASA